MTSRGAAIPSDQLSIERAVLPVEIDGAPYRLQALLVVPPGSGPFPLAVISHGNPRDVVQRHALRLRAFLPLAEEFARRGYLSVVFARRDFGLSSGPFAESFGACETVTAAAYAEAGRVAAKDYRAVIATLSDDARVRANQVVAVGQAGGGFAAMALAADPPAGLLAVVSFAGGRGAREDRVNCNEDALTEAFAMFGATARVPALWLHSETDLSYWPDFVARNVEAYAAGGAPVRLEMVGPLWYSKDGHRLYQFGGRDLWRPRLDAFLDQVGAPTWAAAPQDPALPMPDPPAALSAAGREFWYRYLGSAGHKAFAVAPDGGFGWASRRGAPQNAVADALSDCQRKASDCRVVSLDGVAVE